MAVYLTKNWVGFLQQLLFSYKHIHTHTHTSTVCLLCNCPQSPSHHLSVCLIYCIAAHIHMTNTEEEIDTTHSPVCCILAFCTMRMIVLLVVISSGRRASKVRAFRSTPSHACRHTQSITMSLLSSLIARHHSTKQLYRSKPHSQLSLYNSKSSKITQLSGAMVRKALIYAFFLTSATAEQLIPTHKTSVGKHMLFCSLGKRLHKPTNYFHSWLGRKSRKSI